MFRVVSNEDKRSSNILNWFCISKSFDNKVAAHASDLSYDIRILGFLLLSTIYYKTLGGMAQISLGHRQRITQSKQLSNASHAGW